jgi:hypothetical protein
MSRFLASGGQIVRANVQHIQQVVEGGVAVFLGATPKPGSVDAIVNCTGLGARSLGGVEDKDVYPQRGQTVIVHAPWVKEGRSLVSHEGSRTYIIPRRGGNVGSILSLPIQNTADTMVPACTGWNACRRRLVRASTFTSNVSETTIQVPRAPSGDEVRHPCALSRLLPRDRAAGHPRCARADR